MLDTRPRAQPVKGKTDKLGFIKMKNFCSAKGTVKRIKRQATDWEKIFAKHLPGKGLVSKIYKGFLKSNKKIKNPVKNWAKELNRPLTKENIQMANKHMKRGSTSDIIRGLQIKTTMRYHQTPIRMAEI